MTTPSDNDAWSLLSGQWRRHLRARNHSPRTVEAYLTSLEKMRKWAQGRGFDPQDLGRPEIESFFAKQFATPTRFGTPPSPSTVAIDFRHLRVFFTWLADAEELPFAMEKVSAPIVPEKPIPIPSVDVIRKLLDACKGKGFPERRDTAIIRMLFDCGLRRGEVAGITMADLNVDEQLVTVHGKNRKTRSVPYGAKTSVALDAYLRSRMRHKSKKSPWLWLAYGAHVGQLSYDGIRQMLDRRAREAKLETRIYSHLFRHLSVHMRLEDGLSEGDAMRHFGWSSRSMVDVYGASAADARAIKAARKSSPADEV